jgi:hypothetical protein
MLASVRAVTTVIVAGLIVGSCGDQPTLQPKPDVKPVSQHTQPQLDEPKLVVMGQSQHIPDPAEHNNSAMPAVKDDPMSFSYPATCLRHPRAVRISNARHLNVTPQTVMFAGIHLPEDSQIIDACEVNYTQAGRSYAERYYLVSMKFDILSYFDMVAAEKRIPISTWMSEGSPNYYRLLKHNRSINGDYSTEYSTEVSQSTLYPHIGEITIKEFTLPRRQTGIIQPDGCSGDC